MIRKGKDIIRSCVGLHSAGVDSSLHIIDI